MASLSSIRRRLQQALAPSQREPAPSTGPDDAQDTPLQHVLAALHHQRSATLIHGRDEFSRETLKRQLAASGLNCVTLTPTSLAALHGAAQTVHSFFGFPPTFVRLESLAPQPRPQALLPHVDCILIDDAPSLRADLLDGIDRSLRLHRDAGTPFGGIPILLLGDFLQLPPTLTKPDATLLNTLGYPSHALFAATCLRGLVAKILRLPATTAQIDPQLTAALRKLRLRQTLDEVVALLNKRCYRKHRRSHAPLVLATRLDEVDAIHQRSLAHLRGAAQTFHGSFTGALAAQPKKRLPAPEALELKPGMRVMATGTDPAQRWHHGSLGTVKRLAAHVVEVHFDDTAQTCPVEPASWHSVRHQWNPSLGRIEAAAAGSYRQIPLTPAYATTIQKAHGLRIADIRIDPGTAAFSNALGYIALAAAESLDGVSLTRPLMAWDVRIHSRLVDGFEAMLEGLTR